MFPFQSSGFSMAVVGPTKAGKTRFCYNLVKYKHIMFTSKPQKVLICYAVYQDIYDKMKDLGNVYFHEGMPTEEYLRDFADGKSNLVILDDLMAQVTQSPVSEKIFCVYAHHWNLTVIYICQNFYRAHSRTISLQLHFICLFSLRRDESQVLTIAKQIFAGRSKFMMTAYYDATKEPYSPLIVDCCPSTRHPYRLRAGVLPGECTYGYVMNTTGTPGPNSVFL